MTNKRIAEIKALCEAATEDGRMNLTNLKFIKAARQIIPELLEAIEQLTSRQRGDRISNVRLIDINGQSRIEQANEVCCEIDHAVYDLKEHIKSNIAMQNGERYRLNVVAEFLHVRTDLPPQG